MNIIKFPRDTSFRNELFTPDSFAHPAKMDAQLLIWIVEHFTKEGETMLDCMAGSGTTMLACMLGRNVVLVELEEKFCKMCEANWEKVRQRPQLGCAMGTCQILQGDARNLEGLLVDKLTIDGSYGIINHNDKTMSELSKATNRGCPVSYQPQEVLQSQMQSGISQKDLSRPFEYGKGKQDKETKVSARQMGISVERETENGETARSKPQSGKQGKGREPSELAGRVEKVSGSELADSTEEGIGKGQLSMSDMWGNNRPSSPSDTIPDKQRQFTDKSIEPLCSVSRQSNGTNPHSNPQDTSQALQTISVIVTSPPYAESLQADTDGGKTRIERLRSSGHNDIADRIEKADNWHQHEADYNPDNPNNLGNLPYGSIDSVIPSPPYEESMGDKHHSPRADKLAEEKSNPTTYTDKVDAILTSPPYEHQVHESAGGIVGREKGKVSLGSQLGMSNGYSLKSQDNIGNLRSTSYLEAMAQVYSQCYAVLKPSGLMILVTKNFIREQKEVRLDLDTIKLCEQAGFTFQERWYRKLTSISFWRIIYKQRYPNAPVMDTEDILVFRK